MNKALQVDRPLYSYEFLCTQPYGSALWETVTAYGKPTVVFMAREAKEDISGIPKVLDAHWKAIVLGLDLRGVRIMAIVVMIEFIPLLTIYEVWFNCYGEGGAETQEAFKILGEQENLYLFFFDSEPAPIRQIAFHNQIGHFFRGVSGLVKALPAWTDKDFDEAKRILTKVYPPDVLWRMK